MLKDIVRVKPLADFRLWIRFEDGMQGEIDLSQMIEFMGVFEPLKERSFFERVTVNPELGIIQWSNGADLDPDVLYSRLTGQPLPDFNETGGKAV